MKHNKPVVVVTGSSAGVGRATAVEFGRRGARVALLARGQAGLEGAKREVEEAGGEALIVPTDVSDAAQVQAAAERIEAEMGPIDIWVNAAMATVFCSVHKLSPDDVRRGTEVTYLGSVNGILAALGRMRARGRGTIVQVGSALSYRGIPLQAVYCGAKFAIRGFIDSLQAELRHENSPIHVTMAQLSAFNTPQFDWARNCTGEQAMPVPPVFQPEVAARGIVHAAFHPRRETWVGFPAAKAIMASRWLPGSWIDRYLAKHGYTGQLTGKPRRSSMDNLYSPVNKDMGTHGRFDEIAKNRSVELWVSRYRTSATALATGLALYALARLRGAALMRKNL